MKRSLYKFIILLCSAMVIVVPISSAQFQKNFATLKISNNYDVTSTYSFVNFVNMEAAYNFKISNSVAFGFFATFGFSFEKTFRDYETIDINNISLNISSTLDYSYTDFGGGIQGYFSIVNNINTWINIGLESRREIGYSIIYIDGELTVGPVDIINDLSYLSFAWGGEYTFHKKYFFFIKQDIAYIGTEEENFPISIGLGVGVRL